MIRTTLGAAAALLFTAVLWADDKDKPKDDKSPGTPAEQYQALVKEYNDAYGAFLKAYRDAKTDEEKTKASKMFPQAEKYAGRFLDLAKENPKDAAAIDALVWVVSRAGQSKEAAAALEILKKDHVEDAKMAQVCQALVNVQAPEAEEILHAVIDKNKEHDVQAQAYYALAMHVKRRADQAAEKKQPEADKVAKEAEDLFEKVVADYADVKRGQETMADVAKVELYELRFLGIGKMAPEIEGEDIGGDKMKLSDFKGKVVLLDFWGNW